jgi:hypothetical protein
MAQFGLSILFWFAAGLSLFAMTLAIIYVVDPHTIVDAEKKKADEKKDEENRQKEQDVLQEALGSKDGVAANAIAPMPVDAESQELVTVDVNAEVEVGAGDADGKEGKAADTALGHVTAQKKEKSAADLQAEKEDEEAEKTRPTSLMKEPRIWIMYVHIPVSLRCATLAPHVAHIEHLQHLSYGLQ